MSEIIYSVNEQIHNMEIISKNDPIYYEKYLKNEHKVFMTIKEDLEKYLN